MKILDENGLIYVWSKIKTLLAGKVDSVSGKGLSTEDYTTSDKNKLSGIASGATKNTTTDLLNLIYPVGSIYMSVNSTSPQSFIGGTWERIQDRFLLSAGSSYNAGSTGGAATVALSIDQMPSHNHGEKTLTGSININNMTVRYNGENAVLVTGTGIVSANTTDRSDSKYYVSSTKMSRWTGRDTLNVDATHTHTSQGSGNAHENMPPYLTVYMWKRTA